jgi:hypothetical protein
LEGALTAAVLKLEKAEEAVRNAEGKLAAMDRVLEQLDAQVRDGK